jgi:chromosome segregation ATPase
MRRRAALAVLPIAAALALGACSSDTPEQNSARACEAAAELATSLDDLEATLTQDATVDEIRAARDAADAAQERLDEAADDVARDRADTLDDAWERLDDAVDDVAGDATLAEALDSLRDEAAQVRAARQELVDELTC